ncbi:relaxase domain-containing protein [Microbacterium aurum]
MGKPRLPGEGRRGSPRFAEMVVNVPESLSIAAALHPEVSEALDAAQRDAVAEIRSWLGQHSVTRVGPRGKQEVVPIEQLETVAVSHKTSSAGDPHRHIHFQIGTRVWAADAWRGLDTGALFRQQGAVRALGTAVLAAHPQLAAVLDAHGLTLDPVTGEAAELEPWNTVMSKRGAQVPATSPRSRPSGRQPIPVRSRARWCGRACWRRHGITSARARSHCSSARRPDGCGSCRIPDTPPTYRAPLCDRRAHWMNLPCSRSRRVRSTDARLPRRRGRCMTCRSRWRASSPRSACAPLLTSCATSSRSRRGLPPTIASPSSRRMRRGRSMWRTSRRCTSSL